MPSALFTVESRTKKEVRGPCCLQSLLHDNGGEFDREDERKKHRKRAQDSEGAGGQAGNRKSSNGERQ